MIFGSLQNKTSTLTPINVLTTMSIGKGRLNYLFDPPGVHCTLLVLKNEEGVENSCRDFMLKVINFTFTFMNTSLLSASLERILLNPYIVRWSKMLKCLGPGRKTFVNYSVIYIVHASNAI